MEQKRLTLFEAGFSYPDSTGGKPVFSSLSAEIPLDRPAVIFGANSSGKSTLARLLAGLDSPDKGEITRPEAVRPLTRSGGRLECGVVFENPDFQFHTLTVSDELTVGLGHLGAAPDDCKQALDRAAREFGLAGRFDLPVQSLEAGEKLTVLTAAFLLLGVDLLILDFSLAALEKKFREKLLETVCKPDSPSLIVLSRNALDLAMLGEEASYFLLEQGRLDRLENPANDPVFIERLESAGLALPWYTPAARKLYSEGLLDKILFVSEVEFIKAAEKSFPKK
jgi:energy-coupling factor transport system ATP-binding protein